MNIPDIETLIGELIPLGSTYHEAKKKVRRWKKLFALIEEYFGMDDARIVLAIALALKNSKWEPILYPELKKILEGFR